jgi:Leucine-rich repeat (LRR) protein
VWQVLLLKGNQLSRLPGRMLRHASQLRELSLSFNRLSSFGDESLLDVANTLETLELNMALEKADFPSTLLKPLRHLQWLSLEHNQLSNVPTTAVDHLHQLRYLSLEGNRLSQISKELFKGHRLRQLRDIRLAYNQIDMIETRTFHGLSEVTTIVLANNRIHTVYSAAFDHLPK